METKTIKEEISRALDRILPNENPDILIRKIDSIISICESKKRYIRGAKESN